MTKYYRWIQKNGGYIWIQSSATIAINAKNSSDKNIIWVNYVLRSDNNSGKCKVQLNVVRLCQNVKY